MSDDPLGNSEVEIGVDEEGFLYFEAGSEEAAFSFIGLLAMGPGFAVSYVETHIISYEEADMEGTQDLRTNRVELVNMITDSIERSGITVIETRNDAALLAASIVDGIEDEAERRRMRGIALGSAGPVIKCPACESVLDGAAYFEVDPEVAITCPNCAHEAPLADFQAEAEAAASVRDILCPACGAVQRPNVLVDATGSTLRAKCQTCDHEAPLKEFAPWAAGGSGDEDADQDSE